MHPEPMPVRSHGDRRPVERLLGFLVPGVVSLYARLWHGCRRCGPNTLPRRGAALVIANHPCHADAAFLTATGRRWIHFLQAREYYDVRLLRPFFRLFGCIPVRRGRPDPGAVRAALGCLGRGEVVGLFPEGDLSPPGTDRLGRGHAGAALLALRSGAPVVPAFIAGAPAARGVVADWVRPARGVRVSFGPPVDLAAYHGLPVTHARLREVTELLMRQIAGPDHRPGRAAGSS